MSPGFLIARSIAPKSESFSWQLWPDIKNIKFIFTINDFV